MRIPRCVLAPVLAALLAATSVTATFAGGWPHDPATALPLVVAPRGQCVAGAVTDMKGGMLVTIADPCSLYTSLAQPFLSHPLRVLHALDRGDLDPAWPVTGAVLPANTRFYGLFAPDSLGGLFAVWPDDRNFATSGIDLYAAHLLANGTLDPAWPAGGLPVCTAPGYQSANSLVSDGHHGFVVTWVDRRDSATNGNDIYATHVLASGAVDPAWPVNGRGVAVAPGAQSAPGLVADGAGGAIAVWNHLGGTLMAHHLKANGTLDPAWPAGGLTVATGVLYLGLINMPASDGAGGAFVGYDLNATADAVHVRHVLPNGTLDAGWLPGGLVPDPTHYQTAQSSVLADGHTGFFLVYLDFPTPTSTASTVVRHVLANSNYDPAWPASAVSLSNSPGNRIFSLGMTPAVLDGAGGLVVPFQDDGNGGGIYTSWSAQHVTASGVDRAWPPMGRTFLAPPGNPIDMYPLGPGDGTALFAWSDLRDSASTFIDCYAQRLTADGHVGFAPPALTAVRDTPNDQGGHVTLYWYASAYDTLPADPVTEYDVWRQLSAAPNAAQRARLERPAGAQPRPGDLRVIRAGTQSVFWEFVGSAPSRGAIGNALTVTTHADSTAAGAAYETYEIDAHLAPLNTVISSAPDSGYSVDNIPPPLPTGFAGTFAAGAAQLLWDPSPAPDLAGYRLYRGAVPTFAPAVSNRVASPLTTHWTDTPAPPSYYKLTAVDLHGNEGPAAALLPAGVLGVGGAGLPRELAFARTSAEPAAGRAAFRLDLPVATDVRIEVYDAAGRRVRVLAAGAMPGGTYAIVWDLRDDAGREAASGLYFVRLSAGAERRAARVVLAR